MTVESALHASVDRLRALVERLDDGALLTPADPSAGTISDESSHIGSGAQIHHRRLDDARLGRETPDEFAPSVWDTWNAKTPRAQADDALAADRALVARIESVPEAERTGLTLSIGPLELDFTGFVGLRLNEHTLHTWDVEVALD